MKSPRAKIDTTIYSSRLSHDAKSLRQPLKIIKAMKQGIEFWILIAVGVGVIASLITTLLARQASKTDAGIAQIEEDGEVEQPLGVTLLSHALIFSILAFLIIWLVNAMAGRSI